MNLNEDVMKKWGPVLDHEEMPKIGDKIRRNAVAQILENTEQNIKTNGGSFQQINEDGPANQMGGGSIGTYDPVLITLLRRTMPNLIAYDIAGVQPMTGPTGLIFALRPHYNNQTDTATPFYSEANTAFSSITSGNNVLGQANSISGANGVPSGNTLAYNFTGGMSTAQGEALGWPGNTSFAQMAFSIDKVQVTAQTRALKAEYTLELAQDLKAIHGLDAELELSNLLSGELLAEINREVVRTVAITAVPGAVDTTTAGVFDLDVDSNGRWAVEKFKGLLFQIERECNAIAKLTRRGKGNILICSSDVASALQMAGVLQYTPALEGNAALQVDDTGNTFVGILNGRIKVYIDPYSTANYFVVGYKGASAYEAGLFYCPYVPLQMVRAVGQDTFQPKIGFKTRYGMVANPFSPGATSSNGSLVANTNQFYRRVSVANIL